MSQVAKWLFRILAVAVFLLIAAAVVLPLVFKPQLKQLAKTEINKNINATVEFDDFQVSLLRGFPNLFVGLKGVSIVGVERFAGDTLVSFGEFGVRVNLWSIIDMEEIEVRSVYLSDAKVFARVTADGSKNWSIVKTSGLPQTEEEDTAAAKPTNIRIALTRFKINNATFFYADDSLGMETTLRGVNLLISGNMVKRQTEIRLKSSADELDLRVKGIRYIRDAEVRFNANMGVNLDNGTLSFRENELRINQLTLLFQGMMRMHKGSIGMDVSFSAPSTDFKDLLSLIPAFYLKRYEDIQTSGQLKLYGSVNGVYNDSILPSASIEIAVANAMLKYPKLPKSANGINFDAKVWFDGSNPDKSTVDVNRLQFSLGGNPFDAYLHVATPVSDMQVDGKVVGKVNFATLADVIPLDSISVTGLLETNLKFGGRISHLKEKEYDKFNAEGSLNISNFTLTGCDSTRQVKVGELIVNFSPKFVELQNLKSSLGSSDMQLSGKLENFIPFVFRNEALQGQLNLTSTLLDANELLSGFRVQAKQPVDSVVTHGVIKIPRNFNFTLSASVQHLLYGRLDISNLKGNVEADSGIVNLYNLTMNMLGGDVALDGIYNPIDVSLPRVNLDLSIKDVDIPLAFKSLTSLQRIVPTFKNLSGKLSGSISIASMLDSSMMPVPSSIIASGKLQSKSIGFKESAVFGRLADVFKKEEFRSPYMSNVNVNFKVNESRIAIEPFSTSVGGAKMSVGGDMGFDQSLNFKAKLAVPTELFDTAADALSKFSTKTNIRVSNLELTLKISGTSYKPLVKVDWGDFTTNIDIPGL
ncbi:MAG: AsmA-like C-terminal region-containing protein [Tenuifilaceae bacterium]